jgi:hypothetical protein
MSQVLESEGKLHALMGEAGSNKAEEAVQWGAG